MILVTGTKRSGTSLWLQILVAAGFPYIGSEYSYQWKESIGEANPNGFYESLLRQGVYFATNPHPKTGQYLFPKATIRHAVKVFIPGLVRTDHAFIDSVVASIRPWGEYVRSVHRLYEMEDAFLATKQRSDGLDPVMEARRKRSPHPAEVEWFFENYALVRDFATRRYRYHLVAHGNLVREPERTIGDVLAFLGGGDLAAATAVVDTRLQTQRAPDIETEHLTTAEIALCETLYATIEAREALPDTLIRGMNEAHQALRSRFRAAPSPAPDRALRA